MITIKRIGLNSAFKIGAIMGLITGVIFGVLVVGLQGLAVGAMTGLMAISSQYSSPGLFSSSGADLFTAFSLAGLCVLFVVYVVFSAIGGGLSGLIGAFAFNLSARWVGGLEVHLEETPGKIKPQYAFDDIYE
jgi:hypothetical protein